MLAFITFGFKLIIAAIIGAFLSYSPQNENFEEDIVKTSLIAVLGSSIMGLGVQLRGNDYHFTAGIALISSLFVIIYITKNIDFSKRILWIFSGISGVIIGAGYIFQSMLLCAVIYYISTNNKYILNYFDDSSDKIEDESIKNVSN